MKHLFAVVALVMLAGCSHTFGQVVTDVRPNLDGSLSVRKCDAEQALMGEGLVSLTNCKTEALTPGPLQAPQS